MPFDLWELFAGFGVPGLALAVLFVLFKALDWKLPRVPRGWVGPLLLVFMLVVGAVVITALRLWAPPKPEPVVVEPEQPQPSPMVNPSLATSLSCTKLGVDSDKALTAILSDLGSQTDRTSEESPIDGMRSLKIVGSGSDSALCIRLPPRYKPTSLSVQVRYKWNGLQDGNILVLGPECSEVDQVLKSAFSEYGDFRVYAPGETSYAKTTQERWYTVEFGRIDWERQSYDVYLDGKPVGRELSFSSNQPSLGCIVLYNHSVSVSWWGMLRAES